MLIYSIYTDFVKENWKLYSLYLSTLVSLPLQNVAVPHYYGEIISSLKDNNIVKSTRFFVILLSIWVIIQVFSIGLSYVDGYIWPRFHAYIRQYFFDLIVDRYNQNYQELKIGSILTKLIKLPWIIDDISNQVQKFLLTNSVLVISNFAYLFRYHWTLATIYFLSICAVLGMSRLYFNTCNANIKVVEALYDNCHEEIEDTLQNLLSIYTSHKVADEKYRIRAINDETEAEQTKSGFCTRKFRIYFSIINIVVFIGLNYKAYSLYRSGDIKIANLVSIFIINYTILGSLMSLFNDCRDFMNVKSHVELIQEFIDSLPQIDTSNQMQKIPGPEHITVRMEHIKYCHDGDPSKMLYDDFNITIKPHERIAIMGSIGSGKSTFAKLIARLQTYQEGNIYINDIPLSHIDIDDLRDKVIYIPQHPKLFNRSLWENISYGLPSSVTREDIYKFLIEMGMTELETIFKERMDKPVGKQGSTLSGGQRQMVWLIRAILKKSPFIILDEPTASLDPESKQLVKKMINIMGAGKTLLLITHDEDLKEGMDRILVFSKGKIISDTRQGDDNTNKNFNNNYNYNHKRDNTSAQSIISAQSTTSTQSENIKNKELLPQQANYRKLVNSLSQYNMDRVLLDYSKFL